MRKMNKNEKNNDDVFIKLTAVQLIFCFIAFAAIFLAMKLNSELFESFREEFAILNECDFDLGSYSFFDFGSAREKRENKEKEDSTDEDDDTDEDEEDDDTEADNEDDETLSASNILSENEGALSVLSKDEEVLSVFSVIYENSSVVLPVNGTVTSLFGERLHPVYGGESFHSGEDIAAPEGTSVYAALDGTVIDVGTGSKSGNYVKISHEDGIETLYCHLNSTNVTKGVAVRRGDVIGFVGQTGLATGPHLHFEVKINGEKVDPQTLLEGAAVVS